MKETLHAAPNSEADQDEEWPWEALRPHLTQPDTVLCPLQAAYEVGKLLSFLEFHVLQAALMPTDRNHGVKTNAVFDAISIVLREVNLLTTQDDAEQFVERSKDDWQRYYGSLWFSEEHANAVARLDRALGCVEDFDAEREDMCQVVMRPFLDVLRASSERILDHMADERSKGLVCFGRCLWSGLCPPRVYRHMFKPPEPTSPQFPPGTTLSDLAEMAKRSVVSAVPVVNYLANRSFNPGELLPEQAWLAKVRRRWVELDFPEDELGKLVASFDRLAHDGHVNLTRQIDHLVKTNLLELDEIMANDATPTSVYLGLRLDQAKMRVYLGKKTAEFGGKKILWNLLEYMAHRGENYSSRNDLYKAVWGSRGTRVSSGTVHASVNDLKKLIEPLGITIANMRNTGYRLERLPTSASPSKKGRWKRIKSNRSSKRF